MDGGNEHRVVKKICFKASLFATKALVLVKKAYGNEAMNRSNVFRWYSRFRDGKELAEEKWLSKVDSNWGKHCCCCWFGQTLLSNRIKNDSRIFEHPQVCSSFGFWKRIRERESCVHVFFPHSLTPEQMEVRVTPCQGIMATANADKKMFNKIITGDETCCFACDPETKRQISEWVGEGSPRPKKLKFQRSHIKTILLNFSTLKA